MKVWVESLILPDYLASCQLQGLRPGEQRCLLQIDMYPVHCCSEYLAWLKDHYPYMIPVFVPPGTTGESCVECRAPVTIMICIPFLL